MTAGNVFLREDPATDDCIILDNYENKPSSSTAVKNYDSGKPVNKKVRAIRRTSKLPWNPLEATFHVPQQVLKPSPSLISSDKVIDLNDEKRVSSAKITTIRDVLDELCVPPSPPEEGEIVESSESTETGESCVIDLTHEEVSDNESEVVCMEDLTVVDVEEVSIIQADDVCSGIRRKPSNDDALSRGTKEVTGVTPRYWERLTGAPKLSSGNVEFRVCSYNVLCQLTTLKTMEDNNPLRWENRWPMLEQELLRLNADVYGLQEVQYDHFDSHYRPAMSKGYAAYYKQRTGGMNDGCAVFVRKSKFDVLRYRIVEYFVAAGTTMDRDQIGQVLRLRCKKTGQELIYANTHLLFNSARGDIKIGQLAMLFANIYDVIKEGTPCPVIINGDFNIEPLSYVYTYISESSVYLRGLPRNELSGQGERGGPCVQANNILPFAANIGRDSMFVDGNCPRTVAADYFTHPLCLASVYHHFRDDGKKEVSTYHKEVANPDFIFYSIEKKEMIDSMTKVYELPELRLLRRLGLPDHETLRNTLGPWPNQCVPSDHIPLVADFVLTKSKAK
ncbi:endonuclease/exonuclease/phosphatase family protein [Necator americanus]|uniref:Endonuclease/exonuclease/phosphatase family protein n=1 Tax=Necator americanus TaxID=51031 RepID=W2SHY3_NECAM|nr:endonuclease/exonuclease/phosphatase family protein [Necator americanus]ETN68342.1 endonuclease/exonuclease/phosphatase family protein [Necator americanus]